MTGRVALVFLIAVLALLGPGIAPARAARAGDASASRFSDSFTNTDDNIHLGLAFDYALQPSALTVSTADYIFGGYFADWRLSFHPPVRHIDGYVPFDADAYPQSVRGHSLAAWQATHPDWVVYRCDGKTPAYYGRGSTNVPLDFTNPAVRSYELQEVKSLFAQGASGVVFDNFTFANFDDRCGVYRNGVWTRLGYPGSWQDNARLNRDMLSWLRAVRAELLRQFPTKTLTVSFTTYLSGLNNLEQITPYIDMDFDEAGFTAYGDHNLSGAKWQQTVDALEYLNRHGKAFDVNGIVRGRANHSITQGQINWVLANYLLVKGAHSYTYIYPTGAGGFTGSPPSYGTFYERSAYRAPIGHATSSRYQSQGVQMRNYSGGLVIVNPSSFNTYTIRLSREYSGLAGEHFRKLTLGPTEGVVLLSLTSTPSPISR